MCLQLCDDSVVMSADRRAEQEPAKIGGEHAVVIAEMHKQLESGGHEDRRAAEETCVHAVEQPPPERHQQIELQDDDDKIEV